MLKLLSFLFTCMTISCTVPHLDTNSDNTIFPDETYSYKKFVRTINKNFIDTLYNPINLDTTNHPSIDSLIKQTDQHSSVMYIKPYELKGSGGIGIHLRIAGKYPIVVAPIESAPAFRAGILPNDTLIAIDGHSLANLSLDSVLYLFRGEPGTKVNLEIKRDSNFLPQFELTRELIHIKNISHECIFNSTIGYLRIASFGDGLVEELEKSCDDLLNHNCKTLIIDLRNNNGGLLTSAINSTELFLPPDSTVCIIKQLDRVGNKTYFSNSGKYADIPIKIIVNAHTYSGAEIFAVSLQENRNIQIVGSKTGGFGRVQAIYPINITYSLKLTTGYLLSPLGKSIEKNGVTPDIEVEEPKEFNKVVFLDSCNFNSATFKDSLFPPAITKAIELLMREEI